MESDIWENLHYKPLGYTGVTGDPQPFYWNGEYHVFYLKVNHFTPWAHMVSTDLVHWKQLPIAINLGGPDDPDETCWSGSVIEGGGLFHIFYTGHNSGRGKYPTDTVCHATSSDLIHWSKDPANPILIPDPRWYDDDWWHDPCVFRNEEDNHYWMLITARTRDKSIPRRGCIALAKSQDLEHWEVYPPLWMPYLGEPEVPEVFQIDGRWYLVVVLQRTVYRSAKSLQGPWLRFADESLDSEWFIGGKTLYDGQRRFMLGWIPEKEGGRDAGHRQWGGHLALPREIVVQPDGSLGVRCPQEIIKLFQEIIIGPELPVAYETGTGTWSVENNGCVGRMADGFAFIRLPHAPDDYVLQATLTLESETTSAGFVLRVPAADRSETVLSGGYTLTLEPFAHRVAFDYWGSGWGEWQPQVERQLEIQPGQPVKCQIIVQGTILEAFFNDQIVLTARMYDHAQGQLCLFVENGEARFENICLAKAG